MKFFTIGYGGRAPSDLVTLLQTHGIRTVVDVRLVPEKASMGAYIKAKTAGKGIRALLGRGGIHYVSRKELGNVYRNEEDWRRHYAGLMAREGEERVRVLTDIPGPICLLCAEKRAKDCHRSLIGELLKSQGHEIEHIE